MEETIYRDLKEEVTSLSGRTNNYMGYYDTIDALAPHMDRGDLIQIIKELDYAIYQTVSAGTYNEIIDLSMQELEPDDYWDESEDYEEE